MSTKLSDSLSVIEKASLLSGKSTWETRAIARLGIRSLFLADGPHGIRKQVGSSDHLGINASLPSTCFPPSATLANSWNPELTQQVGSTIGQEARILGVDVVLGPGLNIKRSPLGGRNFEYYAEDPYLSGKLAAGFVRGVQNQGVAACPKHFAANSQETDRMTSNSVIDQQTLRQIYLTAFEIMVKESSPWSIMSSYNLLNGHYTNEHFELLTTILRGDWGFNGAVITDWGGGNDVILATQNGSTLEMPSPGFDSVEQIISAVESQKLQLEDLNLRAEEMLTLASKVTAAVTANRSSDELPEEIPVDEHHLLAQSAAEQSIVLLKNDSETLPLPKQAKVAIVGDFADVPRYQGAGSSMVNPTRLDSTLGVVEDFPLEVVGYARGFNRDRSADLGLLIEAAELSQKADYILAYIGLDELSESEGQDRSHLELPQNQIRLLEALAGTGKPIIAVLSAGSVVTMPWIDNCAALVHGYLGGQAGASAILRVILGKVNPQGRLAETYPLSLEDTSCANYFPGQEKNAEYREGVFVGYRYYSSNDIPVLFPFGFGLSYTSFTYSDLKVESEGLSLTVTNSGQAAGTDTVQAYVGRSEDSPTGVLRPGKALLGFAKVTLEPGASKTIWINFDEYTFRHWDRNCNNWETESGTYSIMVGPNCEAIELQDTVTVVGTVSPQPESLTALPNYAAATVHQISDGEFSALVNDTTAFMPWPEKGPLHLNSSVRQMIHARSPLARTGAKAMIKQLERSQAKGKPDLNLLFLTSMPFRAIAKMSNGMANLAMVESMLTMVNGNFFRGFSSLLGGFFSNQKKQKCLSDRFQAESEGKPASETHSSAQ